MDQPGTANRCSNTNDANWASMLLFGRWNWDGMLFGAAATGPMATLLDATYDYGFAHLSGLPAHTYGGYTGYSTAYDWKCGTSSGAHVAISMDDACAWQYRTIEGVFARAATMTDPYSWQCYSS